MKKAISLIIVISVILSLSACAAMTVDELYSLPKVSEEYLQLEELTQLEKNSGFSFSAPLAGNYRQSILLYDLNGDSVDEALAFFRGSDQTLKICIYSRGSSDEYKLAATIDGAGTGIRKIEFSDLDGDGTLEILVSWQISSELRALKVYSLAGWNASELFSVSDSTEFHITDMDGDGMPSLLVLSFSASAQGTVSMYIPNEDGEYTSSTAKLSTGISSISRLRSDYLAQGLKALFVESVMSDGNVVTDIFIVRGGELANLTIDSETGISDTVRSYEVYATDIDKDGYLEIPYTERLYSQTEGVPGYLRFDWYSFDEAGKYQRDVSTYHCYSDEWYIVLPDDWVENLTAHREDSVTGERVVVFSVVSSKDDSVTDLVAFYKLTGDNRNDRAELPDRFILKDSYTTIYAAKILYENNGAVADFTEEDIIEMFNLIEAEWNVGAL